MALFKIFRGNSKKLPEVPVKDGYAYFCMDDGTFWVDCENSDGLFSRVQINKADWTADIAKAVQEITPHTHTFTPAGTVSQPTFTGTLHTHNASFTGTSQTCSVEYTPAGNITNPGVKVTPSLATVNSMNSVGSLPSLSAKYNETDQCVILEFDEGALPTKSPDVSVLTGVEVELTGAPEFKGTKATIQHTFTPEGAVNIEATIAAGTVSQPTFSGTEGTTSKMETKQGE